MISETSKVSGNETFRSYELDKAFMDFHIILFFFGFIHFQLISPDISTPLHVSFLRGNIHGRRVF